jgi:hypothetical protein
MSLSCDQLPEADSRLELADAYRLKVVVHLASIDSKLMNRFMKTRDRGVRRADSDYGKNEGKN